MCIPCVRVCTVCTAGCPFVGLALFGANRYKHCVLPNDFLSCGQYYGILLNLAFVKFKVSKELVCARCIISCTFVLRWPVTCTDIPLQKERYRKKGGSQGDDGAMLCLPVQDALTHIVCLSAQIVH